MIVLKNGFPFPGGGFGQGGKYFLRLNSKAPRSNLGFKSKAWSSLFAKPSIMSENGGYANPGGEHLFDG